MQFFLNHSSTDLCYFQARNLPRAAQVYIIECYLTRINGCFSCKFCHFLARNFNITFLLFVFAVSVRISSIGKNLLSITILVLTHSN